jgi:anti-sigma factor RsiW
MSGPALPEQCASVRDALAAEPDRRTPELEAHLASCPACARYAHEMAALDGRLLQALRIEVPPARPLDLQATVVPLPVRPAPARAGSTVRRFALAAALTGVAVLAGLTWTLFPRETLAGDVVEHMAEEPEAWAADAPPAPPATVAYVLARSGVALAAGAAPTVTYAHSCFFRGHYVPHLAVRGPGGPVTVLVLRAERVTARREFTGDGYTGVLVPAREGALAVLARAGRPLADDELDRVAAEVAAAVSYRDAPRS